MLQRAELFTWPPGLQRLQGTFNTRWRAFSAAGVLVALPVMVLFYSASRWLVSGLTLSSVQG